MQARVCAAKAAALLDYAEQKKLNIDATMWPLNGVEDLVKMDEDTFKQALQDLQDAGILTAVSSSAKSPPRRPAAGRQRQGPKGAGEGAGEGKGYCTTAASNRAE